MQAGLYGWLNKNLKGRKGQQGFTLIELLVVVTILGVLAAIVTLSLVGLTTNASLQSCKTEYKTVQAALDAYMANGNLDTLPALVPTATLTVGTGTSAITYTLAANATSDMTSPTPLFNPNPGPGSPNFTRNGTTQFKYSWDIHGKIVQIIGGANGCTVT